MIEHLLTSTVVLALAMCAARLPRLTARTRYALVAAGLFKFAIPTALFVDLVPRTVVVPQPLRVFGGNAVAAATPAPSTTNWLLLAWASLAALILGRWMLLRIRTLAMTMRNASAPSRRELDALTDARTAVGVRASIDLLRATVGEAPAVLRVVRPLIVLPLHGSDELSDSELRALLAHECAHVARRDNLRSWVEMVAASLLWFHPLVWLALRDLNRTREEACDERVAEAMRDADSYLDALTKVCRAAVAPIAGVSCMASAHLKERMNHLMRYETLRRTALPHAAVVVLALLFVVGSAAAAAVATAPETTASPDYTVDYTITPQGNTNVFDVKIVETKSGKVLSAPKVSAAPGVPALTRVKLRDGRVLNVTLLGKGDATGEATLVIEQSGKELHRSVHPYAPQTPLYSGKPISLELKDAEIHDLMRVFGQLTGYKVTVDQDVDAKVSMKFDQVPWDRALEAIAQRTGLTITVEDRNIHVSN
ncbi:MAG TPA: M56 family metallopeptidase [Thermoanaerobaculia bacterium]